MGVQLDAGLSPSGKGIALSRRGKNITQKTLIANATVFGGKVRTIPTQEAPPRPGLVRAAAVAHMEGSGVGHSANNAEGQWDACLARLETWLDWKQEKWTGTCGLANPRHNNTECPQLARGLYGKMCSRPGSGDCPFGLSLVSWVSTGTPPASMPWPIARH